jgi:hypothetical protein
MFHLLLHVVDVIERFGAVQGTWMFGFERSRLLHLPSIV